MSNLYQDAVTCIRTHYETTQAALDVKAAAARVANVASYRDLATDGIDDASLAYPVCCLVAHTLTVGRQGDGYPLVSIPAETTRVVMAAHKAGLLTTNGERICVGELRLYKDGSGFSNHADSWQADYDAWAAAAEYRTKQSYTSL